MGSKKFVLTIMGRESKCWAGEWFTVSELIESPAPCATARPLRDPATPPPTTTAAGRQSHKEYDRVAAAVVVAMVARGMNGGGGNGREGTDEGRRRRSKRHTGRPCVGRRSDDDDDDDYDGGDDDDDTRTPRAPPWPPPVHRARKHARTHVRGARGARISSARALRLSCPPLSAETYELRRRFRAAPPTGRTRSQ